MNKQVEQIRAEIERLYDGEAPKHDQQCDFDDGYFTGIDAISKFIDSLPEDEPSKSLEEAAITYATDDLPFGEGTYVDGGAYRGFQAGAEWQKEQMQKELKCREEDILNGPDYIGLSEDRKQIRISEINVLRAFVNQINARRNEYDDQ